MARVLVCRDLNSDKINISPSTNSRLLEVINTLREVQTFVFNSILLNGQKFDCTVRVIFFIVLASHRLQCYSKLYKKVCIGLLSKIPRGYLYKQLGNHQSLRLMLIFIIYFHIIIHTRCRLCSHLGSTHTGPSPAASPLEYIVTLGNQSIIVYNRDECQARREQLSNLNTKGQTHPPPTSVHIHPEKELLRFNVSNNFHGPLPPFPIPTSFSPYLPARKKI